MSVTVDFIFDFGSPNAYLSHKALPDIITKTGATVNYIPCLLGGIFKSTNNQPPMMAFGNVKGKLEYDRVEMMRFIETRRLKPSWWQTRAQQSNAGRSVSRPSISVKRCFSAKTASAGVKKRS